MPDLSEQKRTISTRNLTFVVAGLVLLGVLSLLVDVEITQRRRTDFLPGDFRRIIRFSEIFAHGFGVAVTIYLIWALVPEKRKWIPRLAACAILPGLSVQFVKLFVARYRPGHFFPEFADKVSDTWIGFMPSSQLNFEYVTQSFPSAHAATAVGFATGLVWMLPRGRHLFIGLAFLSSAQRIVAGAHWLSDVFFGAAISVFICGLIFRHRRLNQLFSNLENRQQSTTIEIANTSQEQETAKATSKAA